MWLVLTNFPEIFEKRFNIFRSHQFSKTIKRMEA